MNIPANHGSAAWPDLPLEAWSGTYATLHRWLQIAGKIRLALSPWVNHSWAVTLYVTARGLTTSPIPHGMRTFQIEFDFLEHCLSVSTDDGGVGRILLNPQPVSAFYRKLMHELNRFGLQVSICTLPNEVADPIPFDRDDVHQAYDRDYANRFWRILVQADRVFKEYRSRFIGKCSPVHLFWGAPDLAVTRFSGRKAPEHPGGIPHLPDWVVRDAYSHEVSSCGFWPGGGAVPYPVFYSYAYPEPPGFREALIRPKDAFYSSELREFILPYDAVRTAQFPDEALFEFLESTYEAAADLGRWNRLELDYRVETRKWAA